MSLVAPFSAVQCRLIDKPKTELGPSQFSDACTSQSSGPRSPSKAMNRSLSTHLILNSLRNETNHAPSISHTANTASGRHCTSVPGRGHRSPQRIPRTVAFGTLRLGWDGKLGRSMLTPDADHWDCFDTATQADAARLAYEAGHCIVHPEGELSLAYLPVSDLEPELTADGST